MRKRLTFSHKQNCSAQSAFCTLFFVFCFFLHIVIKVLQKSAPKLFNITLWISFCFEIVYFFLLKHEDLDISCLICDLKPFFNEKKGFVFFFVLFPELILTSWRLGVNHCCFDNTDTDSGTNSNDCKKLKWVSKIFLIYGNIWKC